MAKDEITLHNRDALLLLLSKAETHHITLWQDVVVLLGCGGRVSYTEKGGQIDTP